VFHHVCRTAGGCGLLSVSRRTLGGFLHWLAAQRRAGISVQTTRQALRSNVRPLVGWRPAPAHGVVNPSFTAPGPPAPANPDNQTPDRSGAPSCWMKGGYGANTARWQRIRQGSGGWAMRLTVSHFRSGGAELLPLFDLGACALPARGGRSYALGTAYTSTATTQFAVYYRDAAGRWRYWTSSPYFPSSARRTWASWQTPPLPAGASAISFGLSLFSDGTLTTSGYRFTAASAHPMSRMILDCALLAGLVLVAAGAVIRRARGPVRPAAGDGPRTTPPQAVSGRRAW
jgi:hypothetical protein